MKVISIKIEDEFHRNLKVTATKAGKTIKGYLVELIENDLKTKKEQTQ